jgi:hypothetical protein
MAHKISRLQAINIILSNVGQSPVSTVDSTNPMVATAETIIDEVSHAVQTEGWSFNTESHYPFTPDNAGDIAIPDNVLSLDVVGEDQANPVIRSGRLYDKHNHTYTWAEAISANVVWFFDFEDLPEAFKQYVTIRAANLFAGRAVGSVEAARYSEREEAAARASCLEHETQQGDYSYLGDANGRKGYHSYLPINAVYRR